MLNGRQATAGADVGDSDVVTLDGQVLTMPAETITVILNKPAGYVCSRDGQGSRTVYDLLPPELHHLKTVGRLDKDSSGLLLLTDDGELANRLTHPRYGKEKVYEITLDKPLKDEDRGQITKGVELDDGISRLRVTGAGDKSLTVAMSEGRNRQIRRTFAALGYDVRSLHRIQFGTYKLNDLKPGNIYNFIL